MTYDPTENILLRRDQQLVERRSKRPGGRGGLHTKTMDMQGLCDCSVKRHRSAKSTPNSSQQSPMRETDELHIQNGLPPKKTLRHTAVVEVSNHKAEESSKIKATNFQ
jgi:hypothetical protein